MCIAIEPASLVDDLVKGEHQAFLSLPVPSPASIATYGMEERSLTEDLRDGSVSPVPY